MTELKRFNKILEAVVATMQQEVGALLGADFSLAGYSAEPVDKAEAFEPLKGKQVCVRIEISGEESGVGCLLVGIKDAIRLGGTLIMLPAAELEEVSGREEYSEELADSYGEIANIVAGAFTRDFEELYPKACRFVRKDQEVIVPLKIDTDSDLPVPNQRYLRMAVAMNLEGRQLGEMVMLLPIAVFALEMHSEAPAPAAPTTADAQPGQPTKQPVAAVPAETVATISSPAQGEVAASPPGLPATGTADPPVDPDILLVGDDFIEAAGITAVLEELGYTVRTLSFKDSLQGVIPGRLKAVYLVMREVNEQVFGVAIRISTASSLPLIAAGPAWTRGRVIKAVRYGVSDILLTPASREDIVENVRNNLLQKAA